MKERISPREIIDVFKKNTDFKLRKIKNENKEIFIFFIEGMVDRIALTQFVIDNITKEINLRDAVESGKIPFCACVAAESKNSVITGILRGMAAVLDGEDAYLFDVRKTEKRAVNQPDEESSVKASKDCFVEEVKVNTTLLRKKISSQHLVLESRQIGKQSNTEVVLAYMDNLANEDLINAVREKLDRISVDGIITPGIVEQYLSSKLYSVFPQVVITERPDKVCRNLLSGRCAILVDGLPIGYIVPATVSQFMSTPDDYSGNFIFASVVRVLRYFLLSVQVLLPGAYIALTTFHYEMLPSKLALSIAQAKSGVPFPVAFEILAMLALFEVLVQAGLHMPKSSGQAVSIVGALVVGEAAINADLISPAALIIVAVSVICSFAMPNQEFSNALRLWRVILTLAGGILGLFGVVAGGIVLLANFARLESFGVPYLAPFAGVKKIRLKDELIVSPDKLNYFRPDELNVKNKRRTK